jgi:hypothetical protein
LADNATDLDRLHEIHLHEAGQGAGRKYHVEVLNKAAVVFTCAAWEAFCEDLVREAIEHIVEDCSDPAKVPPLLRTMISESIKKEPHAHSAWRMAGIGWRTVLRENADKAITRLTGHWNTPKAQQVQDLFKDSLGLADVTGSWHWKRNPVLRTRDTLDGFVSRRGEIAHRLQTTKAVHKWEGAAFFSHVSRLADCLDTDVGSLLASVTGKSYW